MSHQAFRNQLVTLASTSGSDPNAFLEGLSPIHDAWHGQGTRTYGFLLFHHRVVRYFNRIVTPALASPIEPFTRQQFESMDVQPYGEDLSGADTLADLAAASVSIENWHNGAHMGVGMATGVPMMDPRQNIFFRPFWQLHFFIDGLFDAMLRQYGNRAHAGQFVTDDAVASHIEARHHGWVARI
ncbi:MAG TPA: hypothetical protein VF049_08565 [Nocardioidaceae bacterium]|jgi:hypothetical protein